MDVLFASTSSPGIHLCRGILWLYWVANWEIPFCLFQHCQLIVQHLEWLITTQDVVRVLIHMLLLVGRMTKPLFLRWLLNPPFWQVFTKSHGIHQTFKWGSWLVEHVEVMLSSMLCQNTGLNCSIKAKKSSLNWWCHLFVGRCYWMKSTTLSFLLILGPKRCMLCCLLMYSGHRSENPVRKFCSNVRFVNILKIAHKYPQVYLNLYLLLTKCLDLGLWTLSLGYLFVQMVVMPFSPVLIVWQSTLFWLHVL